MAIYKNGVRIWPLSAEAYHVPATDKAAMVSVKTAVKAGDTLYYRISTDGPAARLNLSPVIAYSVTTAAPPPKWLPQTQLTPPIPVAASKRRAVFSSVSRMTAVTSRASTVGWLTMIPPRVSSPTSENLAAGGYRGACADFAVGDRVYVYTLSGQTVCDTPALSAALQLDAVNGFIHYQVQVDPAAFNHAILESYDLSADGVCNRRILIDNRSRNGDGFVFDNLLVQNIRSRGFLVKCAGNEIKHCSFRNIGMAAIGLIFEPEWGESGICDNTLIAYNYFENTSYMPGQPLLYSPITIHGLGNLADEDFLPYKNIEIIGNVVRDRGTKYALFINSAMDVTVQGNDFGESKGGESQGEHPSVHVDYARNIAFDGNTYSAHSSGIAESIEANGHVRIFGNDVGDQIPDDPILAQSVYSTSFLDNLPTTKADGHLVQAGAWAVGRAVSLRKKPEFQPYKVYIPGWYTMSEDTLWSSAGGINATGYNRFIALQSSNVGIRYTAEYSGSLAIRIANFTPPYPPSAGGSGDGYFAIFVNDKMVWPVQGGDYRSGTDWHIITQTTTQEGLQASMADLVLELKQGDELIFLSKCMDPSNSSAFAVCPMVYYTRVDE